MRSANVLCFVLEGMNILRRVGVIRVFKKTHKTHKNYQADEVENPVPLELEVFTDS